MSLLKAQIAQVGYVLPRGATLLAQTGVRSLYTIAGGVVHIMQLYGIVTTVIQTQANATKLQAKATGQTAVDLCATADITALAVGQIVGVTGTLATALQTGWGIVSQSTGFLVLPGTIDLNCAASNTGAVRWVLRYIPVDPGAYVTIT